MLHTFARGLQRSAVSTAKSKESLSLSYTRNSQIDHSSKALTYSSRVQTKVKKFKVLFPITGVAVKTSATLFETKLQVNPDIKYWYHFHVQGIGIKFNTFKTFFKTLSICFKTSSPLWVLTSEDIYILEIP